MHHNKDCIIPVNKKSAESVNVMTGIWMAMIAHEW
jgi:hypothetical protein